MTRPDTPRAPAETTGLSLPLRTQELLARAQTGFALTPDAAARSTLAQELGLRALRKLVFAGTITPEGRHDLRLEGTLGATVVQDCVITGAPVTTRIDTPVLRRFLARMPEPQGPEAEIPEDDSLEPLGAAIDPGAVMAEALALDLPDYPRAPGAALPEGGTDPTEDERPNPFAALAALRRDPD